MSMAFSCSSLCKSRNPYFSCRLKVQLLPLARSQNFPDHEGTGNSGNTVDANMSVLRSRIERVRRKERLNTSYYYKVEKNGWNYCRSYQNDDVFKMHNFLVTSFQLAHIVCTTIALVFLTGSLFIYLLSFIFSPSTN